MCAHTTELPDSPYTGALWVTPQSCSETSSGFSFPSKKGWHINPSTVLSSIHLRQPDLPHECPKSKPPPSQTGRHIIPELPCIFLTPWLGSICPSTWDAFLVLSRFLLIPNAHFKHHLAHFQETSVYPLFQLHCTTFFFLQYSPHMVLHSNNFQTYIIHLLDISRVSLPW